jgi:hypothetical protein
VDKFERNIVEQPDGGEIRAALDRLVASPELSKSPQLAHFLTFIVDETLAGHAERIKAYGIAADTLGRDANFDPQNDPIVRVEAGRLRRTLEHYYANGGATIRSSSNCRAGTLCRCSGPIPSGGARSPACMTCNGGSWTRCRENIGWCESRRHRHRGQFDRRSAGEDDLAVDRERDAVLAAGKFGIRHGQRRDALIRAARGPAKLAAYRGDCYHPGHRNKRISSADGRPEIRQQAA